MSGKTNIQVSRSTRDKLATLGNKGDSYDDIVSILIHEHYLTLISNICGDGIVDDLESQCRQVFYDIVYEMPKDVSLKWACEMAMDEDLVGHSRTPNLTEAIINVYCLLEDIPAPTWSFQRTNPFARF